MTTTSASLLERLKEASPAAADWQRLHDIYTPLIRMWLALISVPAADADDLSQEVFVILVKEVPTFQKQRSGSFRAWLRTVVVNRVRTWRRACLRLPVVGAGAIDQSLNELEDPASILSRRWDRDHDKHVFDLLLATVQRDYEPVTWQAFQLFAVEGHSAAEVAAATGLSEGAVMSAKSRILKRLREEAAGLLDV